MVNIGKLKGKIREKQMSIDDLAESINISRATLYRKLNESDGSKLTVGEVEGISKALDLSTSDINFIFFN